MTKRCNGPYVGADSEARATVSECAAAASPENASADLASIRRPMEWRGITAQAIKVCSRGVSRISVN